MPEPAANSALLSPALNGAPADLREAALDRAILIGADLSNALLAKAVLARADLTDARLPEELDASRWARTQ